LPLVTLHASIVVLVGLENFCERPDFLSMRAPAELSYGLSADLGDELKIVLHLFM
jgi:hypothetical protein